MNDYETREYHGIQWLAKRRQVGTKLVILIGIVGLFSFLVGFFEVNELEMVCGVVLLAVAGLAA